MKKNILNLRLALLALLITLTVATSGCVTGLAATRGLATGLIANPISAARTGMGLLKDAGDLLRSKDAKASK